MGREITLVSAPADFGKTTLLSVWSSELSGGRPVAWLSLDAADNDPARFWRYFIAAVDRLRPGAGDAALMLLRSPQALPIETVLTTLLNELADLDADVALVLDDYHLIESRAIHEALTFLIEHLPSHFHLVIATRADPPLPLARLRARGELNDLRPAPVVPDQGNSAQVQLLQELRHQPDHPAEREVGVGFHQTAMSAKRQRGYHAAVIVAQLGDHVAPQRAVHGDPVEQDEHGAVPTRVLIHDGAG
jgi:hypothetical protein